MSTPSQPHAQPQLADIFGYFRLGLTAGLVPKLEPVEWADRHILSQDTPPSGAIELSLSASQSYSEVIYLLSHHQNHDKRMALNLVFARAGLELERNPSRTVDLIVGLRLLLEETHLPADVQAGLLQLKQSLETHKQGGLSSEALRAELTSFLEDYQPYRTDLDALT